MIGSFCVEDKIVHVDPHLPLSRTEHRSWVHVDLQDPEVWQVELGSGISAPEDPPLPPSPPKKKKFQGPASRKEDLWLRARVAHISSLRAPSRTCLSCWIWPASVEKNNNT